MHRKYILILILVLCSSNSWAQSTIAQTDNDQYFQKGMDLYNKAQYAAARTAFEHYLEIEPESIKAIDANYYIAYCAMTLYHNDGEYLLDNFVANHDGHPKAILAFYELGNFYFINKDYKKAISYYEQTDLERFTTKQRVETRFRLGYAHFSQKSFDEALSYFNNVKKSQSEYKAAANYYAGFLEFRNGNYDEALIDLQTAEKDPAYASIVPYMILNVYYKQERYDQLLAYGESVMNSGRKVKNLEDFSLLIAESYYRKQEYQKASQYFTTYVESNSSKSNVEIKYRLAYSLYNLERYDEAEKYFKEIALQKSDIGQNASYHLGNLYLKKENSMFALTAFENAGKMNYNPEIQEEAIFKAAKVSYDQGDYDRSINALNNMATLFPNSKRANEANILLSEAYLNTSDYDLAIAHIEKINNKDARVRKTYQQVTYLKGTNFFNNGKYYESVQMFDKSIQFPEDPELVTKAYFWSGEAYSIGKRYDNAIKSYDNVLTSPFSKTSDEYLRANYGMGYVFFNQKQYLKALGYFSEFYKQKKNTIHNQFYQDALIRLADCNYVNKQYDQAIAYYQEAITKKNPSIGYAYFQKAVILGLQNKVGQARTNFDIVINQYSSSNYYDNALYQKAQLNLEQADFREAANGFSDLIKSQPQSPFVPYALLKRGIANYNLQNYNQSVSDYKKILDNYPTHPANKDAITSLQEVLAVQNKSDEFDPYFTKYKSANPDDESLESIEFETAKNFYNNQQYQQAIPAFKKYIQNYQGNPNSFEAKFFIAESYYRLDMMQQALDYYYQVESDNKTTKIKKSVQRIGDLELTMKNYDKAIVYFNKLSEMAMIKRDSYNAWSGLMDAHYAKRDFQEVLKYGELLTTQGNVSVEGTNRITLMMGKAAYGLDQKDKATDYFMTTYNMAKDEYGAEAQYFVARIQFERQQYSQSIETLVDLNSNFGAYDLWIGKSFLLIADNYMGLKEYFQAEATLNSIVTHSPISEVVDEAKQKLARLQQLKNEQENNVKETIESDTTFQEVGN